MILVFAAQKEFAKNNKIHTGIIYNPMLSSYTSTSILLLITLENDDIRYSWVWRSADDTRENDSSVRVIPFVIDRSPHILFE